MESFGIRAMRPYCIAFSLISAAVFSVVEGTASVDKMVLHPTRSAHSSTLLITDQFFAQGKPDPPPPKKPDFSKLEPVDIPNDAVPVVKLQLGAYKKLVQFIIEAKKGEYGVKEIEYSGKEKIVVVEETNDGVLATVRATLHEDGHATIRNSYKKAGKGVPNTTKEMHYFRTKNGGFVTTSAAYNAPKKKYLTRELKINDLFDLTDSKDSYSDEFVPIKKRW